MGNDLISYIFIPRYPHYTCSVSCMQIKTYTTYHFSLYPSNSCPIHYSKEHTYEGGRNTKYEQFNDLRKIQSFGVLTISLTRKQELVNSFRLKESAGISLVTGRDWRSPKKKPARNTSKPLFCGMDTPDSQGTRRSRTAELSQETGWLGGETQQKWEGGFGGGMQGS